ncbi:hypothetical protein P20652_0030 [Pseudoalteromonas sp. BSi20652]|nr:hypothetical protein P20652_0030 [Pseudoalteromonas sp. BSi20652]
MLRYERDLNLIKQRLCHKWIYLKAIKKHVVIFLFEAVDNV